MRSLRWFIIVNVAALLAVSVWFRCRELGNMPGINGDEAWYGVQAELVLHGEPISWRTPTGNLLNPLFFGPQLLLHALFEPSFALLRMTAVASGLLALWLNYILCRKVFGRRPAVISTVILAVLPIDIVYSRLAWDASQSLLVTLPAVYWSLRAVVVPEWRLWFSAGGLIALAASIIVHPTNLFVAPVIGVALATAWREELRWIFGRAGGKWMAAGAAAGILACGATLAYSRLPAILSRITNPAEYGAFDLNVGRLFAGETVFEYVAGAIPPAATGERRWDLASFDLAAALVAGWLAVGLIRWLAVGTPDPSSMTVHATQAAREVSDDAANRLARRRLAAKCLAAGWGLSLAAFFVVAGPAAIGPHFERYGICLIGPGAILASLGICGWLESRSAIRNISALLALLLGWSLLLSVKANLFDFIHRTGGESHPTFRTAAIEPKQLALSYVCQNGEWPAQIRASEWWNEWPLRYLSFNKECGGGVEIQKSSPLICSSDSDDHQTVWQVEFTNSPACEAARQMLLNLGSPSNEVTIDDFSGRPILSLFRFSWQDPVVRARILNHKEHQEHEGQKLKTSVN